LLNCTSSAHLESGARAGFQPVTKPVTKHLDGSGHLTIRSVYMSQRCRNDFTTVMSYTTSYTTTAAEVAEAQAGMEGLCDFVIGMVQANFAPKVA
jgi:hypothetical protein